MKSENGDPEKDNSGEWLLKWLWKGITLAHIQEDDLSNCARWDDEKEDLSGLQFVFFDELCQLL
jgi:hypothetical protein